MRVYHGYSRTHTIQMLGININSRMKDKIKKTKFIADAVANGFLLADRKLALLEPLIEDEDIYKSWNGTNGAFAVDLMRMTLYTSIISDMRSLLFDNDKRAVSVQQIVNSLENEDVSKALRQEYAQASPVEMIGDSSDDEMNKIIAKQIQQEEMEQLTATFDEKRPEIIERFRALKESDLCRRLALARNKMISHREINNGGPERALYNPADFSLKWDDAKNILCSSEAIILDCCLIINDTHVDLESFRTGNRDAGGSFWSRSKNA